MSFSILVSVLLLIVISVVLYMFVFKKRKTAEHFTEYDPREIVAINTIYGKRQLKFSNLATNTDELASFRSVKDDNSLSDRCNIVSSIDEDKAIVHENFLVYYNLKYSCISINVDRIKQIGDNIEITFDIENSKKEYMNILLLNPLFIEFDYDGSTKTIAYFITNNYQNIKNFDQSSMTSLKLLPIKDYDYFKYNTAKNRNYTTLEKLINKNISMINARVYYLDEPIASANNKGRTMDLKPYYTRSTTPIIIYDKVLGQSSNDADQLKPNYHFFNKITLARNNNATPIFTFKFKIKRYTDNSKKTAMQVYMGPTTDKFGYYGATTNTTEGCWTNIDDLTVNNKNNNIMSVVVGPHPNLPNQFRLYFMTGIDAFCHSAFKTNRTPNEDSIVNDSDTLILDLPRDNGDKSDSIDILVTVSPNEKYAVAFWYEEGGSSKLCTLSKKRNQNQDSVNNFKRLFISSGQDKPSLENINLAYSTSYIGGLDYVSHGYVNFRDIVGKDI